MSGRISEKEKLKLIKLSQAGDIAAFGELIRFNQAWLRGWLRGKLRDWTAADDLAQDTFVTAFQKIKQLRDGERFEAWIRSIAHNHFRNYIRKHREEYIGGSEELQSLIINHESEFNQRPDLSLEALRDCLNNVQQPAKKLLEDCYIHDKSVKEIAKLNGQGYSAMTMQLHRLRKSLAICVTTKLASQKYEA